MKIERQRKGSQKQGKQKKQTERKQECVNEKQLKGEHKHNGDWQKNTTVKKQKNHGTDRQ